jgi:hypothetical protein
LGGKIIKNKFNINLKYLNVLSLVKQFKTIEMNPLKNIFLKLNKVKNKKIIRLNKFNQEFINVYSVKPSNLVMFVIQKE